MCGIAGFNWPDRALVQAMTDAIGHRCLDNEDCFVDELLSLGHRRVSLVDLSEAGRQPMVYEHGGSRALVVFNGEIFNFQEVRRELHCLGYPFRSGRDTEVILASSLEWGLDCVRRFNGMRAFALYEPAANRRLLSRDRFGGKPLPYYCHDDRLIFANEIKSILAHPLRRRTRREVVSDYLYKAEANSRLESFFDDVLMLPPAHNAVFDLEAKTLQLQRYDEPRRDSRRMRRRNSARCCRGPWSAA